MNKSIPLITGTEKWIMESGVGLMTLPAPSKALSMPRKFVDTRVFEYQITESGEKTGAMKVQGIFQKADVKNGNGRVYPMSLWKKVISDAQLMERLSNRMMIGEVEHPADGLTNLNRASHIITDIRLDESTGDIVGEAEIFNTPSGLILQELFRRNVKVGISSRGKGTSFMKGDSEVVNDDYIVETFDFVYNPSTPGAYPDMKNESVEGGVLTGGSIMDKLSILKKMEAKIRDYDRLIEGASQTDLTRFDEELVEYHVNVAQLTHDEPTLSIYGKRVVEVIDAMRQNVEKKGGDIVKPKTESKDKEEMVPASLLKDAVAEAEKYKALAKENEDATPKFGTYKAEWHCSACSRIENRVYGDKDEAVGSFTKGVECECGNHMNLEAMYASDKADDHDKCRACPTCPEECMEFHTENGSYKCPQCGYQERLKEALSKGELVAKLGAMAKLNEGLLSKCRDYLSSNKTLRSRYEEALKLIKELVERNEHVAVQTHMERVLRKHPQLRRAQKQLESAKSIKEFDKKAAEFLPLIESTPAPRSRKQESTTVVRRNLRTPVRKRVRDESLPYRTENIVESIDPILPSRVTEKKRFDEDTDDMSLNLLGKVLNGKSGLK